MNYELNKMKERIPFVDYIRVIACFMVMLVHSSENFYAADSSGLAGNVSMLASESNRFWVAFWDGGISRTAVPLFMIISAFLLVPMPEGMTMTQFYRRRFKRILPPFICFLLLYTSSVMGRNDLGAVDGRHEDVAIQLSLNGWTSVVYVSTHQSIPNYSSRITMA